jgi:hypothetical protein
VSDKTVTATRGRLEATAEIPQLEKTTGADGKARPTRLRVEGTWRNWLCGVYFSSLSSGSSGL